MTPAQLRQIRQLADGTRSAKQIAEAIGIEPNGIYYVVKRENLALKPGKYIAPRDQILRLAAKGLTSRQIAAEVGCSRTTALSVAGGRLRRPGSEHPPLVPDMVSVVRSGSRWVVMTSTTCDSEAEARVIERRYRATA